jgi:hypothetical protein
VSPASSQQEIRGRKGFAFLALKKEPLFPSYFGELLSYFKVLHPIVTKLNAILVNVISNKLVIYKLGPLRRNLSFITVFRTK